MTEGDLAGGRPDLGDRRGGSTAVNHAPRRSRGRSKMARPEGGAAKMASTVAAVDWLDADMCAADLVFTLEHLTFSKSGTATLQIDPGVARFFIDALTARCGHAAVREGP